MIVTNDSIKYKNVVSKKYYFYHKDFDKVYKAFFDEVMKVGYTLKGPFFYSINNVPKDEMVYGELFIPVNEDKPLDSDELNYQSYFNIENMLGASVFGDFLSNTEYTYGKLLAFIDKFQLKQVTPIYHIISSDDTMNYALIKIGVAKDFS